MWCVLPRLTTNRVRTRRDGRVEAKEAFAAIPGLAAKDRVNPFVMIISDNDTKLSGRITKDSFRTSEREILVEWVED